MRALLAAALAAGAAWGAEPIRQAESARRGEAEALLEELQALLAESHEGAADLRGFIASYSSGRAPRDALRRRAAVRARAARVHRRLLEASSRLKVLRAHIQVGIATDLVGASRGRFPGPEDPGIKLAYRVAERLRDSGGVAAHLAGALSDEELAYSAVSERGTAARAALLAAAVLLAGWLAGRLVGRLRGAEGGALSQDLPGFRLLRLIGKGGMGLVFEAEDLGLGRIVAVKRVRPEMGPGSQACRLLLQEARLVATLRHPNILEIYSVFEAGGSVNLVFERLQGETLADELRRARRLRLGRTVEILRGVGAALDYAHARKVIHRDLNPANIMVTGAAAVKVMDFGIARRVQETVGRLTGAQAWGTLAYMAPEQEMGAVCRESDLFALGVCLYEMLTGGLPFPARGGLERKRRMEWAPARRAAPELPEDVEGVLLRALQAEPARRFHSAAELLAALSSLPEPRPGPDKL